MKSQSLSPFGAALFAGAALLPLLSAQSARAADLDGASLFAIRTCVACHGEDANTPLLPIYPRLRGQVADYAYNQMQDIKSGARSNGQSATMRGSMYLTNDAEMRAIANWLESLK